MTERSTRAEYRPALFPPTGFNEAIPGVRQMTVLAGSRWNPGRSELATAPNTGTAGSRGTEGQGTSNRSRILEVIGQRPGITFSGVAGLSGVSNGTADYHLHRLEREGLVSSAGYEGRKHYRLASRMVGRFVNLSPAEVVGLKLASTPGLPIARLSRITGRSRTTLLRDLAHLRSRGLLGEAKVGKRKVYWITDKRPLLAAFENSSEDDAD